MPTRTSPRFALLGEPLAVDLANTRINDRGCSVDLLATPAALQAWLHAEDKRIAWSGRVTGDDLAAMHTLRDTLATLLDALVQRQRPKPAAVAALNTTLAGCHTVPERLQWDDAWPRRMTPGSCTRRQALLHTIAADALTLLTGPDAKRVRKCARPDCILRYVARNPRRRWCSDATCGNRARVARHYLRHRQDS